MILHVQLFRSSGHPEGESLPSSSNAPSEDRPGKDVKTEREEDSKSKVADRQWLTGKGSGRRGRPPSAKRMKHLQEEVGEEH
jgi:hypothetical protein